MEKAANIAHGQQNEKFINSKSFQNSYNLSLRHADVVKLRTLILSAHKTLAQNKQ